MITNKAIRSFTTMHDIQLQSKPDEGLKHDSRQSPVSEDCHLRRQRARLCESQVITGGNTPPTVGYSEGRITDDGHHMLLIPHKSIGAVELASSKIRSGVCGGAISGASVDVRDFTLEAEGS